MKDCLLSFPVVQDLPSLTSSLLVPSQALLDLHKLAGTHDDAQMQDFLESHYLTEQVEAIKEISDHITNLKRNGPGLGEYLYDKHNMQS